jgi:hypothetical protein
MIENVLLNVIKQMQFVETVKENEMKNAIIEQIIELLIAKTTVVKNVQK